MAGETYDILNNIFSGQTPLRRKNPQMGESEYYYVVPGQNDWTSLTDVKTVDVPSADTPNPYLQPQTTSFGQPAQVTQNNLSANDESSLNTQNQSSKFDFVRGKDMGNGWETTPDFSYLNNSPLHIGLTSGFEQKTLKNLDTSLMRDREIIDTPYSNNILENDCYQSERFYPFAMRVRWNEGENQGITYATPQSTGTDQNTKYGISQNAYDGFKAKYQALDPSYSDLVGDLTEDQGMNIQCQEYYKPSRAEAVNDANTGFALYDSFFNGYNDAAKAWQQTLRNYGHPDLQIGGGIGSGTINALNQNVLPSSFKQDLITNRLNILPQEIKKGIANRLNTYNLGNVF